MRQNTQFYQKCPIWVAGSLSLSLLLRMDLQRTGQLYKEFKYLSNVITKRDMQVEEYSESMAFIHTVD